MRTAARPGWLTLVTLAALLLAAGCGGERSGERSGSELTFERLTDTDALTAGPSLLESFDAYRMDNGALRVKGRMRLPDGTRVRIAIRRAGGREAFRILDVEVLQGGFDSPPILGAQGVLPQAAYLFEISVGFEAGRQPPEVLRATRGGRALRGPGVTRARLGEPLFTLSREMTR